MLVPVLESDALRYYSYPKPYEGPFGGVVYNDYLREPPRVYDEAISAVRSIFTCPIPNAYADYAIGVLVSLDTTNWPGWENCVQLFDPYEGRYIRRINTGAALGVWHNNVHAGANNDLFATDVSGLILRLNPVDLTLQSETYPQLPRIMLNDGFVIDVVRDRALFVGSTSGTSESTVAVYQVSTGELLYAIPAAGNLQDVCAEDGSRAWVLGLNGELTLVDYMTGEVLNVTRQVGVSYDLHDKLIAFDRRLKRLLFVDSLPDAVDGACQTRIKGFHAMPQPVMLTEPLPLKKPRAGRTVPVLVHAAGDAGEAIGGITIRASASGDSVVKRQHVTTDHNGNAIFRVACTDSAPPSYMIDPDDIDSERLQAQIEWYQNSLSTTKSGAVEVHFYDATMTKIGSVASEPSYEVGTIHRSMTAEIPAQTRHLRLALVCDEVGDGFDALSCRIEARPGETAPRADLMFVNRNADAGLAGWNVIAGAWRHVLSGGGIIFRAYSTSEYNEIAQTVSICDPMYIAQIDAEAVR